MINGIRTSFIQLAVYDGPVRGIDGYVFDFFGLITGRFDNDGVCLGD